MLEVALAFFFSAHMCGYTFLNKLTVWSNRQMTLQKMPAGARAFSLPSILEKVVKVIIQTCACLLQLMTTIGNVLTEI